MNKKPFWRRVNRGFVVSMALLAIVLVYILVTQLMLIPARQDIRKLADDFRGYMESTTQLSDEQITSFKNDETMDAEKKRLKTELSTLFVKDSGYLDAAVDYLTYNINMQTQGMELVTSRSDSKLKSQSYTIDQDVATCTVINTYTVSGKYMDYDSEELKEQSDLKEELIITITCKKEDGKWKIYRVGQASFNRNNQIRYGGV